MSGIKEKPKTTKPAVKSQAATLPQRAGRMLKEKYLHQLDPQQPSEADATQSATEQVESSTRHAVDGLIGAVPHKASKKRAKHTKEKGTSTAPPVDSSPQEPCAVSPKHHNALVQQEHPNQLLDQPLNNNQHSPNMRHRPTPSGAPSSTRQSHSVNMPPVETSTGGIAMPERRPVLVKERPRMNAAAIKSRANLPRAARSPGKDPTPKVRPRLNQTAAKLTARRTRQHAQRQITQRMVTQARNTARATATVLKRAAIAVVKAAAALIGSLVSIAGGGILLVVLVIVVVIAAVANSPFGLFFAAEKNAPDTVSVAEAVAQVNIDYNVKLEELQAGDYDSIEIHGQALDWPDVLAVFAAKIAGADIEGMDVATLDAARVAKLKAVFEDMTAITSRVEEIDHPGDGEDDPGWTEYILHITITPKSANDMRTAYAFTAYQNSALDELLTDRAALSSLAGSLTITNTDVSAILDALPDDLSPERREAVRTALQLVGKVSYFWGGKSYAIGWDSRWGTLQKVWAAGNSTSGTYRPFGLDCSGFVDWVFNNAMGHIPGRGGGASAQHTYSTDIPWADAQPGDLAFFPDDSHVGIVVGRSADGGILVCHCSYSQNNVVVTDCTATGFTTIGRPDVFD